MPNVCVLQICTPDIQPYTKYSFPMNLAYCLRHGYDYRMVHHRTPSHHPTWGKIIEGRRVLLESDPLLDEAVMGDEGAAGLMFILDADAVVINRDIGLESIAARSKASVMACENGPNGGSLINAGALLVRKDSRALALFDRVLGYASEEQPRLKWERWHEQEVLNTLFEDPEWQSIMEVFPTDTFNSYWLADTHDRSRFVYHYMARGLDQKAEIAKELFDRFGQV